LRIARGPVERFKEEKGGERWKRKFWRRLKGVVAKRLPAL